jgi:phosphoribosylaminoimidazolecarboxamide formyltransferase/IMP cyclohydrolase
MNTVAEVPELVRVKNVLISVSDKTGIEEFVRRLIDINPEVSVYSTGGTHRTLASMLESWNGGARRGNLKQVSEYTGQPEMQGGLVKTLDYRIYLGLLSEPYNADHAADLERTDSLYIDMVVVNLYPFARQVASEGNTLETARSHIDIGGPTMLRASAKNYIRVASVCDPADYPALADELAAAGGCISLKRRFDLAKKTFAHTAAYDAGIIEYLRSQGPAALEQTYEIAAGEWS